MRHRKTRRVYDVALQYERLYSAWDTVSHTCKNKQGLYEFSMHAQARISQLLEDLRNRKYYPNKYRCFMIFEPKPRLVMSQSIRDKVVNHFVAREYLLPLLERTLMDVNVATRKGMGSSYASKKLQGYFSEIIEKHSDSNIYALKIDVSKYFYSIDHDILFSKLRKKVKDKDVLEILRRIVDETNKPYINKTIERFNKYYNTDIPYYKKGKGLSIGAMTSQFLAIFYLGDLDRFIKENLKQRYFLRYMDDFLILGTDKEDLKKICKIVETELNKIELKMNPKTAIYNCCSTTGFSFLGYKYIIKEKNNGAKYLRMICLPRTVKRIRHRLAILCKCDPEKYLKSYESYRGYFSHALPSNKIEKIVGEKICFGEFCV